MPGGEGAEVIYALRNNSTLAASILDEIAKKGQVIRKYYQRRLPSDPSQDYYYIIRETNPLQSLIVEYGFIDNQADVNRLQKNLLDYAEGVVRAVANYRDVPYTSPSGVFENTYIVQAGDSLWKIANKFGITVDALKAANGLTTNIISIGQQLLIPTITPEPSLPGEYIIYIVQAGDSLWKIANQYGVSVDDIVKLNQLDTTVLTINQQLLIPSTEDIDSGEITYIVQTGDSLWKIANQYDITVDQLKAANNLTSDLLSIGQELLIPNTEEMDTGGITYVVQAGDSLWKIANQYNITVDQLKAANNLTSNLLSIGQELLIPNTEEMESETITEPEEDMGTTGNVVYVVKSGDSLYSIAKKYGVTVDELKVANNLSSSLLSIGQQLIIPSSEDYITYYVQAGDSLYSIATRFNTTVDKIKQLNNLTSNNLSIGQVLLIA